jgi:hypothetical protein
VSHPTNDAPPKQLQMLWPRHLQDSSPESLVPAQDLPAGYRLRTYRPEDETAYLAVMHAAGFTWFDHADVQRWLDKALPDGLFLVEYGPTRQIAATAMATHNPGPLHPFGGELGWVAGSPEHAGKHLGTVVCAAATARWSVRRQRPVSCAPATGASISRPMTGAFLPSSLTSGWDTSLCPMLPTWRNAGKQFVPNWTGPTPRTSKRRRSDGR